MKIKITKTESGYEIEASDEEILNLFNKVLESISKHNEEATEKIREEFHDILGQILGGSP
jgi:hypothetical protein